MKYLIDSDILSYVIAGDETTIANFKKNLGEELCISPITTLEQYFGMEAEGFSADKGVRIMKLMEKLIPIPFDERAGRQAGIVRSTLQKQGKNPNSLDSMLAGHAIALGATLVTNNTKDFKAIPGLRLVNWAKKP